MMKPEELAEQVSNLISGTVVAAFPAGEDHYQRSRAVLVVKQERPGWPFQDTPDRYYLMCAFEQPPGYQPLAASFTYRGGIPRHGRDDGRRLAYTEDLEAANAFAETAAAILSADRNADIPLPAGWVLVRP